MEKSSNKYKTCGNCGHSIPVPVIDEDGTEIHGIANVCSYDYSLDLVTYTSSLNVHANENEPCEAWIEQSDQE